MQAIAETHVSFVVVNGQSPIKNGEDRRRLFGLVQRINNLPSDGFSFVNSTIIHFQPLN